MVDIGDVQKQYMKFATSMFAENATDLDFKAVDEIEILTSWGYLDEQFAELHKLSDKSEPEFVLEIISIFFNDSDKILHNLTNTFDKKDLDFNQVYDMVQVLKGSSLSIGAKKVKDVCNSFMIYCEENNLQECLMCLMRVKEEYKVIKVKLETLLSMQKQIMEAGGVVPVIGLTS